MKNEWKCLYTQMDYAKEFGRTYMVEDAPDDAVQCIALAGSQIGSCIKLAKEMAKEMDKTMAFHFNGVLVLVDKNSDETAIFQEWQMDLYGGKRD